MKTNKHVKTYIAKHKYPVAKATRRTNAKPKPVEVMLNYKSEDLIKHEDTIQVIDEQIQDIDDEFDDDKKNVETVHTILLMTCLQESLLSHYLLPIYM